MLPFVSFVLCMHGVFIYLFSICSLTIYRALDLRFVTCNIWSLKELLFCWGAKTDLQMCVAQCMVEVVCRSTPWRMSRTFLGQTILGRRSRRSLYEQPFSFHPSREDFKSIIFPALSFVT